MFEQGLIAIPVKQTLSIGEIMREVILSDDLIDHTGHVVQIKKPKHKASVFLSSHGN